MTLIGHSMGGLIAAGYLQSKSKRARVSKVVTVGTPYQGSLKAIRKMMTGEDELSRVPSGAREREAARLTPSLYYLLPSFEGSLKLPPKPRSTSNTSGPNLTGKSIFDPAVWRRSIPGALERFFMRHSVKSPEQYRERAAKLFTELLGNARRHRERLAQMDLDGGATSLSSSQDYLCLIGVGVPTR